MFMHLEEGDFNPLRLTESRSSERATARLNGAVGTGMHLVTAVALKAIEIILFHTS